MPKMIGNGTIYQDSKTKHWVCQYVILNNDNTKSRKSVTCKSKADAISKLAETRYMYDNNKVIEDNGIKLNDLLVIMREDKFKSNLIGEAQYHKLEYDIKRIKDYGLGDMCIQDIAYRDIQDFMNYMNENYSPSTIDHTYQLISKNFEIAAKRKYIKENPCDLVIKPRAKKKTKKLEALTLEEQQKLSSYLMGSSLSQEIYKNVFLIQMYMGLRISETLALQKDDIDLDKKIMSVNKTMTIDKEGYPIIGQKTKTEAGTRELPIPDFLMPYIKEQLLEADKNDYKLLFYNHHMLDHSMLNSVFKRICSNLGILKQNLSTHVLRHTYGTRCIESGMPPVVLQRLMGHTDIKITLNTYTSVLNKFKEDEIDKVSKYYADNNLIMKLGNQEDILLLEDETQTLKSDNYQIDK